MEPTTALAIGGGAGNALSGIYAANKSAHSAKQANKISALVSMWSQQRQEEFEKWKMANAYQETVKDMKKAGINPILGAVSNGPNSAGSLGQASMSSQIGDFSGLANAGNGINTAVSNTLSAKQLEMQESATNANNFATIAKALGDIERNKWIAPTAKSNLQEAASRMAVNSSMTAKNNLEAQYDRETMSDRIAQQAGKAEQELSKGYIGQDAQKFLMTFGLTKDQIKGMTPEGAITLMGMAKYSNH